ncbi:Crp/Fnr family transcriptional regulator [Salinarimonas soli]|uniref:Helix-turn-helix domain-containing protein n=1 Tax=Salinarimonas soli TaxID=1638099 RepID=A0A5B2V889_9HYPH|nr:helix-turn-helix domain-containing protein [Salinarimonas soli]KAA2235703.1 helix-turn-helix domain-containing protein [Salinarimonas soli]
MTAPQTFSNAKFDAGWSLRFEAGAAAPAGGRIVSHRARAMIVDEGDTSNAVYEIVEGGVMVFKLLPDGRRQIIEVLGVGDVFGLASTAVSDVSAEALTPVRLAMFDRRAVDLDAALRDRLFQRLRAQMCALHDHALLLGRKSARERVATFIMRLVAGRGGVDCSGPRRTNQPGRDDRARVGLAMTRQEIADYLGLTIETVSRAFSALRRDGTIAYDRQDEVQIGNVCGLCRLTGSH